MRVFNIRDTRGEFRLEIEDEDKITFGPAIPFPARMVAPQYGRQQTYALRVYARDGKTLRAAFPGVFEIVEASVKVTRTADDMPMGEVEGMIGADTNLYGESSITPLVRGRRP